KQSEIDIYKTDDGNTNYDNANINNNNNNHNDKQELSDSKESIIDEEEKFNSDNETTSNVQDYELPFINDEESRPIINAEQIRFPEFVFEYQKQDVNCSLIFKLLQTEQ